MSGPCTLEYVLVRSVLLGAESALRSARDVGAGIAAARDAAARDALTRADELRAMRDAARQSIRHQVERTRALEAALDRMRSLAAALTTGNADAGGTLEIAAPARPAMLAEADLGAYSAALEAALGAGQTQLSALASRMAADLETGGDAAALERLVNPRSLDDVLDGYLASRRSAESAAALAARRARIAQLLGPIASADGLAALPADVRMLLAELGEPGDANRMEAVELELNRLVTRERTRREAAAQAASRARELLAALDRIEIDDPRADALRQTLELVVAGLVPLTPAIEERARSLAVDLQAAEAEALRAAAARVLEGTLADLGFVTEPIGHTLFMAGGVAHFSRPEWGEYAVRLRASPADGTLNFNVVREAATGAADTTSAYLRDLRAEETWCEHIPKLQETLAARGIGLKVRRLLGAGEAPVQVVPDGTLAQVPRDDARRSATPAAAAGEAP